MFKVRCFFKQSRMFCKVYKAWFSSKKFYCIDTADLVKVFHCFCITKVYSFILEPEFSARSVLETYKRFYMYPFFLCNSFFL